VAAAGNEISSRHLARSEKSGHFCNQRIVFVTAQFFEPPDRLTIQNQLQQRTERADTRLFERSVGAQMG
jgi:hypothetical protein